MLAKIESDVRRIVEPHCASLSNADYEEWARMAWTKPIYKRADVDRAGALFANLNERADEAVKNQGIEAFVKELTEAFTTIDNWRSSHSYPLQVIKMTLLTRAKRIDSQAIIAQRLKRISSIETKLQRNPNMKLSQMQDLGGCRAVLGSLRRVNDLVALYEKSIPKNPYDRPKFLKKYDYVASPKADGYRSVHYVYKYQTKVEALADFKDLRIEIQIRTRLQHAWATAVETVSSFTGQALKSNVGALDEEGWRRFFTLMGSFIAGKEGCPPVEGSPTGALLKEELRHLASQLDVRNRLQAFGAALKAIPLADMPPDAYYALLELDLADFRVDVRHYKETELERANNDYLAVEKFTIENPSGKRDAVLVSVDSMANLRRAYPNYFLDTTVFVEQVRKAVE